MINPVATGILFALAYIVWGFFVEGGDSIGTWLPDRLGYGLWFGLVAGVLMYAKEYAKSKAADRRRKGDETDSGEQG